MQTITVDLFKFDELSDEAKKVAIEWFRGIVNEDMSLLGFTDDCERQAAEAGFDNAKVRYSLGYSQGDGVSFKAEIDVKKFLKLANSTLSDKKIEIIASHCEYVCKGNEGRYAFANKSDIDLWLDSNKSKPNIEALVAKTMTLIEDTYMDLCHEFEKQGYADIDYQNSDESITETIEANEYDFTANGKRFKA